MDFVYLQTFCEVVKWGNFAHAADELGYAPSSVTAQIKKLEEAYGVVLFERSSRSMRLTLAGEVLFSYAKQILTLQNEAQSALSSGRSGTLRIRTIDSLATFFFPSLLQSSRQMYPQLTLVLQSNRSQDLIKAVKVGECDLGVPLDRPFSDPELECVLLKKVTLVVVLPPTTPYRHLEALPPSHLTHAHLLLPNPSCTYRIFLERLLQHEAIPYQVVSETDNLEVIKQGVQMGLGTAFLPLMTVQAEIEQGILHALPLTTPLDFFMQAVYLKKSWKSRAFQDLLQLLVASTSLSSPSVE